MNALATVALAGLAVVTLTTAFPQDNQSKKDEPVQLGNFSVSLAVKDIKASVAFYEKLDFKKVGGDLAQNWIILQNGTTTVGLFQEMFEKNLMTFNPGWTHEQKTVPGFQDVRELQKTLKARGLKLQTEADEKTDGPASFVLVDPDGNTILFDQHVPKPKAASAPEPKKMKGRVTGVGGVFFKSADKKALSAWYEKHLGMPLESWGGAILKWPEDAKVDGGLTVWNAADKDTKWFAPSDSAFMINYRVDDLDALLASLTAAGVKVLKGPDADETGKFAWILDPEGNKVELWEPLAKDEKGKR